MNFQILVDFQLIVDVPSIKGRDAYDGCVLAAHRNQVGFHVQEMVAGEGFEPIDLESMRLPCEPLHQPAVENQNGRSDRIRTCIVLTPNEVGNHYRLHSGWKV